MIIESGEPCEITIIKNNNSGREYSSVDKQPFKINDDTYLIESKSLSQSENENMSMLKFFI